MMQSNNCISNLLRLSGLYFSGSMYCTQMEAEGLLVDVVAAAACLIIVQRKADVFLTGRMQMQGMFCYRYFKLRYGVYVLKLTSNRCKASGGLPTIWTDLMS